MDNQDPPVYRASYELTLAVCRFVKDCHPSYKPTLGLLLQQEVLKMANAVYHVNDSNNKARAIQVALDSCYLTRMIVNLFLDLSLMKIETNIVLNANLDNTAKQLSGWKKAQLARANNML